MAAASRKVTVTIKRESTYRTSDGQPWPSRKEAERQQAFIDLIALLHSQATVGAAPESVPASAPDFVVETARLLVRCGEQLQTLLRAIHKGDEPFTPPPVRLPDLEGAAQ